MLSVAQTPSLNNELQIMEKEAAVA